MADIMLKKLGAEKKALVVLPEKDENVVRATANLPQACTLPHSRPPGRPESPGYRELHGHRRDRPGTPAHNKNVWIRLSLIQEKPDILLSLRLRWR